MRSASLRGSTGPPTGKRLIFVGGAPRSGTTLVQNMLDCHPDIVGGPEFHNLAAIAGLREGLRGHVAKGWITDYVTAQDVDGAVAGLVEALLLPLADRRGMCFVSEKTPGNVLVFEALLELFPEARCIHVVRDPRGTVASLLRVGARAQRRGVVLQPFTRRTRAATNYVKACLHAGVRAGDAAPDRVLHLRYERLIADPQHETRRVCGFLGIPWDAAMLTPGAVPHIGERAMTEGSDGLWYDVGTFRRGPHPDSLERWRRDLSPLQAGFVTGVFADFEPARRLGYALDPADLRPVGRATAGAVTAVRRARRAGAAVLGQLRRREARLI